MRRVVQNTELLEIIRFPKIKARDKHSAIWAIAAEQLSGPRRRRATLNLDRITRSTKADQVVLVLGKVLGAGLIKHAVIVGALEFSRGAQDKIERAGGKCIAIREFVDQYPDGSNVKIMR